jgi:hypothetical protein
MTMLTDSRSKKYQGRSDLGVGVRLIGLSVFVLRPDRLGAAHHTPAFTAPTGTNNNDTWGWLTTLGDAAHPKGLEIDASTLL